MYVIVEFVEFVAFHLESKNDAAGYLDISDEKIREDIFKKISNKAILSARLVAHFLLPYDHIQRILMERNSSIEKLLNFLYAWYNQSNCASWTELKAVLLFLQQKGLINEIEGKKIKHSYFNILILLHIFSRP